MKQKYELLAPVGAFPQLHAAIEAGADAVYFGLNEFNMRDSAKNFSIKDLDKIGKICNSNKKKIKKYLTLNTIIYDSELKRLESTIKKIKGKIDAVICWDLSVIELCRKYKIPFHVSTQASISNSKSAEFYKKLGAERIVLARELNLKQIKQISKIIEIECFCHGAMCVSVSGRCFTSQFLHGKSANRGQCTHPCRRAYHVKEIGSENELILENSRVMSAKDLCTLPFIDKMKQAGITSFKIEGRNRNPEYVYTVVKEYRKALDRKQAKQEIAESIENLKKVYNRGFSDGFYFKLPTSDDFSFSENGEQKETKEFIARVEKYWPKPQAASLKLFHGKLKIGDEIYIIGDETGIKRAKITSLERNNQQVTSAEKGEEVGAKLLLCRKGDEIYLIKQTKNI